MMSSIDCMKVSGSRMKVAGRFKPCVHMGCFDLHTFVEINRRTRKVVLDLHQMYFMVLFYVAIFFHYFAAHGKENPLFLSEFFSFLLVAVSDLLDKLFVGRTYHRSFHEPNSEFSEYYFAGCDLSS